MQDQTAKGDAQVYVVLATDPVGAGSAAAEATAKGVKVVAAFTPFGGKFDTLEPQVEGTSSSARRRSRTARCSASWRLGLCRQVALQRRVPPGPEDPAARQRPHGRLQGRARRRRARRQARRRARGRLHARDRAEGRAGRHPGEPGRERHGRLVAGDPRRRRRRRHQQVALIGNGSSKEAFAGVNDGSWYAPTTWTCRASAPLGRRGRAGGNDLNPPTSFDTQTLHDPHGTKDVLADVEGVYSDLG